MALPTRVTIAFSNGDDALLKKLSREANVSTSELVRRAIKFYSEYQEVVEGNLDRKVRTYLDMLPSGEHLIVDIEHWILFMKMVETLPPDDKFWDSCVRIARDHAEQFHGKITDPQTVLERLEDCNFFRLQKESEREFTLVLSSEVSRRFVEFIMRQLLSAMGFKADLKSNLSKIRVRIR